MEFERLKASIVNNESEEPSIYLAMCMIEALFADIENASQEDDISACPAGDDGLPLKLTWLSKKVSRIYSEKNDELVRGRERLNKVMGDLERTRSELAPLAQLAEQRAAAEREYRQLDEQLDEAKEKKLEFDRICARRDETRAQLQKLSAFDAHAAEAELKSMQAQVEQLKAQEAELGRALSCCRSDREQLAQSVGAKQKERQEGDEKLRELQAQNEALDAELARLSEAKQTKDAEHTRLSGELSRLKEQAAQVEQDIQTARASAAQFRQEQLQPLTDSLQKLRAENETKEKTFADLKREEGDARTAFDELVLQVEGLTDEIDLLRRKVDDKQTQLTAKKTERDQLDGKRSELTAGLGALQDEIEQLQNETLPNLRSRVEEKETRKKTLLQSAAEQEKTLQSLEEEIARVNREKPDREQKLSERQAVYDKLTAALTANDTEIGDLNAKISELEKKTDAVKLETFKNQLQSRISELEKMQRDCVDLDSEIADKDREIRNATLRKIDLEAEKSRREANAAALADTLERLRPLTTPESLQNARQVEQRLDQLTAVQKRLFYSLDTIRNALQAEPLPDSADLRLLMNTDLDALKNLLRELQSAMINCADYVRLEEQ